MHKILINTIISVLKILYTPIILPFRYKTRVYIYNYFLENKITFLFKNIVFNKDEKFYYNYQSNDYFIPYVKTNRLVFYLHYYLVWIWLDDNTIDNINVEKLTFVLDNNVFLSKLLKNDLLEIIKKEDKPNFIKPESNININKYTLLFYISLCLNKNNYYNHKYYNKTKTKLHRHLVFINDYPMYKI